MASRSLTLVVLLGCGLTVATLPEPTAAQCQLCQPNAAAAAAKKSPPQALTLTVETAIDFSKIGLVVMNQGGTVLLDPVTGQRTLTGRLVDLGGIPVTGTVLIRGEPKEMVNVTFPATVQLFNSSGASYPLTNFTTTLKTNPKIGDDGTLRFTFGGLLRISGSATGTFRGLVPITVDYK